LINDPRLLLKSPWDDTVHCSPHVIVGKAYTSTTWYVSDLEAADRSGPWSRIDRGRDAGYDGSNLYSMLRSRGSRPGSLQKIVPSFLHNVGHDRATMFISDCERYDVA
jgi:hypothetical protein